MSIAASCSPTWAHRISNPRFPSTIASHAQVIGSCPAENTPTLCNWLQIMENAMDPVHTAFLHTIVSGAQFTEQFPG